MNLQELTPSERILLAEELWDSVASDKQLFALTQEQKKVIDDRLAHYSADPDTGDSWESVRHRISNL
ncbi:MAG: addiction module protein [Gammaproteobacteria bacterium]|nr:addiction module protein [Gammaproteobacteria bacterium]